MIPKLPHPQDAKLVRYAALASQRVGMGITTISNAPKGGGVRGVLATLLIVAASVMGAVAAANGAEITCIDSFKDYRISDKQRSEFMELYGRLPNGECVQALIRGPINVGDSAKFAKLLRANHPFIYDVLLSSPGGSVEEAMKIGRLIRKELLSTQAPISFSRGEGIFAETNICNEDEVCQCASACFLIWAGGTKRRGSTLGVHRPTTSSTAFSNLPPERASVLYRDLLLEIDKYLAQMEIPRRFGEMMTDTSSTDIRWLSRDEADSLYRVPSVAGWLIASCGALTETEKTTMDTFGREIRERNNNASQRDRMLYDQLSKKDLEIGQCEERKLAKARSAIKEIGGN